MNTYFIRRICIFSWWPGWSSKFFGLLIHQRRGDGATNSLQNLTKGSSKMVFGELWFLAQRQNYTIAI
jgi:hypothetical protein